MNGNKHEPCYGNLFPDTLYVSSDWTQKGKVFSYTLSPAGLSRCRRETGVNLEQWDRCTQCPQFENCYKLSMAKLAMKHAIANA